MKIYGGSGGIAPPLLIWTKMEVSGQLHDSAAVTPGNHCVEGWVGLRAGLNAVEKRKSLTAAGN
jgi:hypothetical protein